MEQELSLALEFNQRSNTMGRSLPVYQIVDDFGDLLGLRGCRQYPDGAYGLSWAYFANGDGCYPRSWKTEPDVRWL